LIEVAKLGKTVGLKGFMRLHILSDFPEQFKKGVTYHSRAGELTIESLDHQGNVKFVGFNSKEDAATLTNLILSSTEEESEALCELDEDEFFWHDIIGLDIYENDRLIGRVEDIERYPSDDHLLIHTDEAIIKEFGVKRLLLPYNDRTVASVDLETGRILVHGALETLAVIAE